jgi:dTDP-4-amino-4,6-dideoxygalactose transaminase
MKRIPFDFPAVLRREAESLAQAAQSKHLSGDGSFRKQSHALLELALGICKMLLTPSCTQALGMPALLLDLWPGDEIIVPSFTSMR